MAAEITFTIRDDRGREILDELEEQTGRLPYKIGVLETDPGGMRQTDRTYYLDSANVGVDGFDAILEQIDADWREHLSRTA